MPTETDEKRNLSLETGLLLTALAGAFVASVEICRTTLKPTPLPLQLPTTLYCVGAFLALLIMLMVHVLPMWGACHFAVRWTNKTYLPWFLALVVFAISWQETIMQGDAVKRHPLYLAFRLAGIVLTPLGLVFFAWFLVASKWVSIRKKRVLAVLILLFGLYVNTRLLLAYRPFHGHLVVFNALLFMWLAKPLVTRAWVRLPAYGVLVVAVVAVILAGPERLVIQGHLLRFSLLPASILTAAPLSPLILEPLDLLVDTSKEVDPSDEVDFKRELQAAAVDAGEARGRNVLIVVLEAMRWTTWEDPETTVQFQRWKQAGTYFPTSICSFPSTLIAYGSMFASQSMPVLLALPNWNENRLMDLIRHRFDHTILSSPDKSFFDGQAVVGYMAPPELPVNRHATADEGLAYVQERIESRKPEESFYAWVHLFEPHDPYLKRGGFDFGDREEDKYRSSVAYVDDRLGTFMKWFQARPENDDTLVIVVGDHGQALGDNLYGEIVWGHSHHVNNVLSRVPMWFSGPGIPKGEVIQETMVGQIDIMPSIYDFLGEALPRERCTQGWPVTRILEKRPKRDMVTSQLNSYHGTWWGIEVDWGKDRAEAFKERFERFKRISTDPTIESKIGLQYGPYKAVYDRVLRRCWIYDTRVDPLERNDLSRSQPEILEEFQERLKRWVRLQGYVIQQLR